MATPPAKEGGGSGGKERERKGNSSSNPQTKITKPSTKPSTSQQPSSSSNKPIPNYLKPTISSSLDPSSSSSSRIMRRSSTLSSSSATTAKPASVNRRLSLDKPPSSTTQQKSIRGPTNTATNTNTNTNTRAVKTASGATPSSTLPKSVLASVKPAPQRSYSSMSLRSTKAAASAAPPIRRSLSTKAPSSSGGLSLRKAIKKTAPKSVASDSSTEVEAHDKDLLDHIVGGGQGHGAGMDDHEVESLPEISEMPGQEEQLGDPVMMVQEAEEVQNVEMEGQDQDNATEEQADEQMVEDAVEHDEESVVSADRDGTEEKGALEGVTEEDSTNVEEKHVVVVLEGSSGGEGSKEGEETEAAAEEVAEPESPAEQQTQAGNKKETQAYNDVIEETASKLMENKRNKVRALAGAFETVISLDSK